MPAAFDFNVLEVSARKLIDSRRHRDAIKIYLFMADGDTSPDGGYLGEQLGRCYEAWGDIHEARFWCGRAVEQNPKVRQIAAESRNRLLNIILDDLRGLPPSPN